MCPIAAYHRGQNPTVPEIRLGSPILVRYLRHDCRCPSYVLLDFEHQQTLRRPGLGLPRSPGLRLRRLRSGYKAALCKIQVVPVI